MRIHPLALILGTALTLAACGDKDDDTGSADGTDGADGAADGADGAADGADGSSDGADGTAQGTAQLSGTVKWGDGRGAEGLQMRLCYEQCLVANTDTAGNFVFENVDAHDGHLLQAVALGQLDVSTPHSVINLAEDEQRTLEADLTITDFVTWDEMSGGASDYTLDGGLKVLGASASDLTYGSYTPDPTQDYVASVRMDPGTSGLPMDGLPDGAVVKAMWYLGNFDAEIDGGWSFALSDSLGLTPGAQLQIFATDNIHKGWTAGGTATVQEGGTTTSDTGSGIPLLTTFVLVELPAG